MQRERERERERGAILKRRDIPEGTRTHAHFYDWYSANPPVCMFHARVALTDVFLVARLRIRHRVKTATESPRISSSVIIARPDFSR